MSDSTAVEASVYRPLVLYTGLYIHDYYMFIYIYEKKNSTDIKQITIKEDSPASIYILEGWPKKDIHTLGLKPVSSTVRKEKDLFTFLFITC